MNLRQIKTSPEDFGLMTYDPGVHETQLRAAARHHLHRRWTQGNFCVTGNTPIEVLGPERCTFLKSLTCCSFGRLADRGRIKKVGYTTLRTTPLLHESTKKCYGRLFAMMAIPWGCLSATVAALSTVYPDARHVHDSRTGCWQIKAD